jgi:hypothetical protein
MTPLLVLSLSWVLQSRFLPLLIPGALPVFPFHPTLVMRRFFDCNGHLHAYPLIWIYKPLDLIRICILRLSVIIKTLSSINRSCLVKAVDKDVVEELRHMLEEFGAQ